MIEKCQNMRTTTEWMTNNFINCISFSQKKYNSKLMTHKPIETIQTKLVQKKFECLNLDHVSFRNTNSRWFKFSIKLKTKLILFKLMFINNNSMLLWLISAEEEKEKEKEDE